IRLAFAGAQKLQLKSQGELLLQTPGGILRQHRPVVYQEIDGVRRLIPGGYILTGRNHVGFQVARYDRSQPLVIDPTLSYLTYLGGNSIDRAYAIAVDDAGSAYVTGYTWSTNFPGAISAAPGSVNVFVTKLSAAGSLAYSVYLGGSSDDYGYGIAVDSGGNAFVTGLTNSSDFPTTASAFQRTYGTYGDAFVTKLNATGSA